MSASGVNLYDDDLAADVRALFRELLQRGTTGFDATAKLIEDFGEVIGTHEESVFWLALAAVQWEYGMLQPHLLERALRIIEDGSDLARWADNVQLQGQRQEVLASLATRLRSSNRRTKKTTRKKAPPKCDWNKGDVFAYRLQSGLSILLRVVVIHRSWVQELPVCELLDWIGTDVPKPDVVSLLPIRRNKRYASESMFYFPMTKRHLARCHSLNLQLEPTMRDDGGYKVPLNFDELQTELNEYFGMSVENGPAGKAT